MSWLVTEPNRRPSTPAFCVSLTLAPASFSPWACAAASFSAACFGQEAGALDGSVELALENGARASQAGWNDFAVFSNEVAQGVDVFVVDFFYACYCKAAETFALEQQGLGITLWAFVFVGFKACHDGLSFKKLGAFALKLLKHC